ncbi:SDR family oxidoreductase [Aquibacillus sediminis]|uniref:SDR family oxidoreductase n=1 Tax=Aquibacillus sediminis TaxID=2574734 RepID=UPI001108C6EC|nr:SDR family oxidoreductase [Aquibacillus sediminis]
MDLDLKGKSVIVAAGSKGIGRATALEFAKEGAHVLIGSREEQALKEAVSFIKEESGNQQVDYRVCDITDPNSVTAFVKKALDWNGKVDVLINNAGGPPAGKFEQFDDQDWQAAFELNLLSYIRLAREVLPSMQAQQQGRIINIASSSIKQSLDNLILSNTFRAGMVGLSKTLAREYANDNIMVNTIGPGRIDTERLASLDENTAQGTGQTYDQVRQASENTIPIGRYGSPEEFARIVVFLSSGANTYMTGQNLVIDGGLVKAL